MKKCSIYRLLENIKQKENEKGPNYKKDKWHMKWHIYIRILQMARFLA